MDIIQVVQTGQQEQVNLCADKFRGQSYNTVFGTVLFPVLDTLQSMTVNLILTSY